MDRAASVWGALPSRARRAVGLMVLRVMGGRVEDAAAPRADEPAGKELEAAVP